MWPIWKHVNCMGRICDNVLDLKKDSYWVLPGSGSAYYCGKCFGNGNIVKHIHRPMHYTNGVSDEES